MALLLKVLRLGTVLLLVALAGITRAVQDEEEDFLSGGFQLPDRLYALSQTFQQEAQQQMEEDESRLAVTSKMMFRAATTPSPSACAASGTCNDMNVALRCCGLYSTCCTVKFNCPTGQGNNDCTSTLSGYCRSDRDCKIGNKCCPNTDTTGRYSCCYKAS